jgi:hypothetical protein
MPIKNTYVLIFSLFVASCASIGNVAPAYVDAYKTIKGVIVGYENELITPDLIKNIPFASSTLKIGKGASGLIILESKEEELETWVSSDGVYLVFKEGRIVKTSGFFNNLINFKSVETNFASLMDTNESESLVYYYSYDDPELIDMRVQASRRFVAKEKVQLIDREEELNLIEEQIVNHYIGWEVTNKFWIDDDMFVWKSEQYISPKLPKFYTEVTKKPAS